MTDEEKFFAAVEYSEDCWEWVGGRIPSGYGHFQREGAHRWSYRYFVGEIPDAHQICHHCDNPPCVNPFHLFLGTRSDNMKDGYEKGRVKPENGNRIKTHCPKGHPYTGHNLMAYKNKNTNWVNRKCRACLEYKNELRYRQEYKK